MNKLRVQKQNKSSANRSSIMTALTCSLNLMLLWAIFACLWIKAMASEEEGIFKYKVANFELSKSKGNYKLNTTDMSSNHERSAISALKFSITNTFNRFLKENHVLLPRSDQMSTTTVKDLMKDRIIIQFEAMEKLFVISLIPHDDLLANDTIFRLYKGKSVITNADQNLNFQDQNIRLDSISKFNSDDANPSKYANIKFSSQSSVHSVPGKAYIGNQMVVIDLQKYREMEEKQNSDPNQIYPLTSAKLLEFSEHKDGTHTTNGFEDGIEVSKSPFGRFYIEFQRSDDFEEGDTEELGQIIGGFSHKNYFITLSNEKRLQNAPNSSRKEDGENFGIKSTLNAAENSPIDDGQNGISSFSSIHPSLEVTVEQIDNTFANIGHRGDSDRSAGKGKSKGHKCGVDKLFFNYHPSGSLSSFARQLTQSYNKPEDHGASGTYENILEVGTQVESMYRPVKLEAMSIEGQIFNPKSSFQQLIDFINPAKQKVFAQSTIAQSAESRKKKREQKVNRNRDQTGKEPALAERSKPDSDQTVMYIGVVADCSYVATFDGDLTKARATIINNFNLASAIYEEAFNIRLGIISIDLMVDCEDHKSRQTEQSKTAGRINKDEIGQQDLSKGTTFIPSDSIWKLSCDQKVGLDARLSSFTEWRGSQPKDAGIYHLLTACNDNEVVGLAWIGQVCRTYPYRDSVGEMVGGTSISAVVNNHFSVIAHELAHNFGAPHDCDIKTCPAFKNTDLRFNSNHRNARINIDSTLDSALPTLNTGRAGNNFLGKDSAKQNESNNGGGGGSDCCKCSEAADGCDCGGRYIMNAVSGGKNLRTFSPCTLGEIKSKIPVLAARCLNPPGSRTLISSGICGNGIREGDEECDCGGEEGCKDNPCCTSDCKLKSGAVCSDQNDACCNNCQIVSAAEQKMCYKPKTLCKKPVYCNGISRDCVPYQQAPDGSSCELGGNAKCASGICTSRSLQCAALGNRLGLTEACDGSMTGGINPCTITCRKPGSAKCLILDADFLNGTPCGLSGRCMGGKCSESPVTTFAYHNAVPLGVLVGAILFVFVVIFVRSIFLFSRNRRRNI